MRTTRRFRGAVALAVALSSLAVLLDRPLLLVGAAGLAAWLLAAEYAFLRAVTAAHAGLAVEQTPDRERVLVDDPVRVSLGASFEAPAPCTLTVEAGLPVATVGASRADRTVTLERGERRTEAVVEAAAPTAGTHRFRPATITATGALGLLTTSFEAGPAPTLTVEPRGPRRIHVGAGGERAAAAFGEHALDRRGVGLLPLDVREYSPGEAASRIDWKVTARLSRPFVREREAETDRVTTLVVDHRHALSTGAPGETELDYLRHVALAVASAARDGNDPLGFYAVGDAGLTRALPPSPTAERYAAIRRHLFDLEPTAPVGSRRSGPTRLAPDAAGARAERLADDGSSYARTLVPYFGEATTYVRHVEARPLFRAVRAALARRRGTGWTVLLTDDADRTEVREAVRAARQGDAHVLVFLAPRALYEPGGLSDLATAYDRYRDFESFRRELDAQERVEVYEVAPGDRLDAVLGPRRQHVGGSS